MAFSSSFSVSIFLLVLLTVSITIESVDDKVTTSSNALATGICNSIKKELDDVPFCLQVFRSVPGANETLDLKSFVKIAVDSAIKIGTDTEKYIHYLVDHTTDKSLKDAYSLCDYFYDSFLYGFQSAKQSIQDGNYASLVSYTSIGFGNIGNCNDTLSDVQDQSGLLQKNKFMYMLVYILGFTFDRLTGAVNHLI